MKKGRAQCIIGVLAILACGTIQAQELPLELRREINRAMTAPLVLEISPLSLHNFTPQQGWMMWELRELDRRQRTEATQKQLAQKSLEPVKEQFQKRKPKVEVKVRVAAGNSAVQNWSPYPDRALDARVIRYPMPRSAAHGK